MNIFITGATGFVGSYLVKKLLNKGNNILCLTRNIKTISLPTHNDIEFIQGDINKPESYKKFLKNVDVVYHLAGYVKHEAHKKEEAYINNVIGTRNIFNLALENKVKKVVYLSSAGIFHSKDELIMNEESKLPNKFINYYAFSKYLGYMEVKKYIDKGLNILTIMPVSIYGEGSQLFVNFLNFLVTKKIFFKKFLNKKLSLVYVEDVVDAIIKAGELSNVSREYLLTGNTIFVEDFIKYVENVFKIKIKILDIPIFIMRYSINFLDFVSKIIGKKFFINKEIFSFLVGNILVSSQRAKDELSWEVSEFDKTFLGMVIWYKNNLK